MKQLAQIIEALSLEMDFDQMCRKSTQVAMEMMGADVSALALPLGDDQLAYQYLWGLAEGPDTSGLRRPLAMSGTIQAFSRGVPIYVPDYPSSPYAQPAFVQLGLYSGLAVPVMIGKQVAGVFSLGWLRPTEPPQTESMELMQVVARQVGIAYHRTNLMRDLALSESKSAALNTRLNRILAVLPAIIYSVTLDINGPVPLLSNMLVGENVCDILGRTSADWMADPNIWYQIVHPDDLHRVQIIDNLQALEAGRFERLYRIRRSDGEYIWVQEDMRAFPSGPGRYDVFGIVMDVTERQLAQAELDQYRNRLEDMVAAQTKDLRHAKNAAETAMLEARQAEDRLRQLAHYDALTGLANRVLIRDRLEQMIGNAQRHDELLAVMFIDLDRFKNVNDSLGHSCGDRLLQEVAQRLHAQARHTDTIGRLSGDEFVVLLSDFKRFEDVVNLAEQMITVVSLPYAVDGVELVVTLSMGISLYPADGRTPEDLIKTADTAMYKAKEAGRNNYQFFTQTMGDMARDRLALESALRAALERGELELYYQPQLGVHDGVLCGIECLLRWHHPERGLLLPEKFIAIAEESGLIVPIGNLVLREACRQNRAWQLQGLPHLPISVNISPLQFRSLGLLREVESVLRETGLAPGYLQLELTESLLMHHAESTIDTLRTLKQRGIGLAIDDFGTGYSSLTYLRAFPIDMLKVDRSFINDLPHDQSDATIVRSIIDMGHNLGLKVLAEGVVNPDQLASLREWGCDSYQGFYGSKPVPAHAFERLLRAACSGDVRQDKAL